MAFYTRACVEISVRLAGAFGDTQEMLIIVAGSVGVFVLSSAL